MPNILDTPLSTLAGVGPRMSSNLERLELRTIQDLIFHFPHRYDDFRNESTVGDVELNVPVTLTGQIWTIKNIFTKNRKKLTQALFNDGTNSIELVWFNSHWITNQLHGGDHVRISGKVARSKSKLSMVMPVWEKVASTPSGGIHTGRLVPIYNETSGVTSKWLREKISKILPEVIDDVIETLPDQILGDKPELKKAISEIHFPTDLQKLESSRKRLAFEELFYIQLATQKVRMEWLLEQRIEPIKYERNLLDDFVKSLNFELTGAQKKVLEESLQDLEREHPMNRLIQGDVGSGKTVIAAMLMYLMAKKGFRSVLMAPTEVLAIQHFETLRKWLDPLNIKTGIQTGSIKSMKNEAFSNKSKNTAALPDVVVGTHALIAKKFELENIGLVVIDEQHRFGVNQRNALREMAKIPHFLSMTATPIPRTVALTMYGDLDISIVDEMPRNRIPVKTHIVPKIKRYDAYRFVDQKITDGDQVYIVVPLIDDSETLISVKAVKSEFDKLKEIFPNRRIGLLHGQLKPAEKNAVIDQFKNHQIDILVSTSVVEVGVDVPNATIMIIEGAERFGLASLHQLRGRVGRGDKESFCFLFISEGSEYESERLKILTETNNGLILAEMDLKIRGAGEVFGRKQSGRFELKIASLADLELIEEAKQAAIKILSEDSRLDKYPWFKLKLGQLITSPSPD